MVSLDGQLCLFEVRTYVFWLFSFAEYSLLLLLGVQILWKLFRRACIVESDNFLEFAIKEVEFIVVVVGSQIGQMNSPWGMASTSDCVGTQPLEPRSLWDRGRLQGGNMVLEWLWYEVRTVS